MHLEDVFNADGMPLRDPMEDIPGRQELETFAAERVEYFPINPLTLARLPPDTPSRGIELQIRGDVYSTIRMHFDSLPDAMDDKTHQFNMHLDPSSLLEPSQFANWARTEAKKLVIERRRRLRHDVAIARMVGAALLTDLAVSRDLLPVALGTPVAPQVSPLTCLVNIHLPFFEGATPASLAKARTNEVAYFEFRAQMSRALAELAAIADPSERTNRAAELTRDIIETPLKKVQLTNRRLRERLFINCGLSVGSLGGLLMASTGSGGIGGAALAGLALLAQVKALETLKEHLQDRNALSDTPGFFYWQAAGRPRSKRG